MVRTAPSVLAIPLERTLRSSSAPVWARLHATRRAREPGARTVTTAGKCGVV